MAGYSKIYFVGGLGGFQGADGINPIQVQIWVGDADRQWLESHYVDRSIKPIGKLRRIVPAGPNSPHALLDACIAFFPQLFEQCPSLAIVHQKLKSVDRLDFNVHETEIPSEWPQLRREAWPYFKQLNIFEADLKRVAVYGKELT